MFFLFFEPAAWERAGGEGGFHGHWLLPGPGKLAWMWPLAAGISTLLCPKQQGPESTMIKSL